jgi:activator of HSP90 ATPase
MNQGNFFRFSQSHIEMIIMRMSFAIICLLSSPLYAQTNSGNMNKAGIGRDSANSIVIHQETDFKVPPKSIYQTILSSKEFSDCIKKSFPDFTAMSATIDPTVGGSFTLFDGHIIGRILELVPNQRIVEAWRVVDWPAGDYSIAKFELKPQGSGTHLIFEHIGFPEGLKLHLAEGWQQHYWDALNKYFQ